MIPKMTQKKIFAAILLSFLLILPCISGCLGGDDDEDPVKISAILSLTGPGQLLGESVRNGMELAMEDINSNGGMNGRNVEMILRDSESSPQRALEVFDEIIDEDPLLIITTLSSVSVALSERIEDMEVPLIGLVATAAELTIDKDWTFRYWPLAETEVPPALAGMEMSGVEDLGVLHSDDEFGDSVMEFIEESWDVQGGNVSGISFDPSETDFTNHIEALMDNDGIYLATYPGQLIPSLQIIEESGYEGVVGAIDTITMASIRSDPLTDGVVTSAPYIYDDTFLFASEISTRYEDIHGIDFDHIAGVGYDVLMLIDGLLSGKEISHLVVRDLLVKGFIPPGVFGEINMVQGGHDITFPLYRSRIVDGEVEYL